MMPSATDWRSVTQYQYLTRLDRPGFGWEFLRRNEAYQEDYNTFAREAAPLDREPRSALGLSFHTIRSSLLYGASILAPDVLPTVLPLVQRASRARAHSQ